MAEIHTLMQRLNQETKQPEVRNLIVRYDGREAHIELPADESMKDALRRLAAALDEAIDAGALYGP